MKIEKHTFKVEKTAHYTTYGELTDSTKYFWFLLHGSHMLSEQMVYKFAGFNPKEHFIVSPEGLSRFYLKGFSGDVVATWMTKQDRLIEINDFTLYLSNLYTEYYNQLPPSCKKIILGFSQGGTSAFSWLHRSKIEFDEFVGYSTWIPEDIDFAESKSSFESKQIIYTIGKEDEYMTEERMAYLKEVVKKNGFDITYELYNGTHRISKEQLNNIFKKYLQ